MEEGKKILIVDDDKFLREMYVTKFSANGFVVEGVDSTRKALDKFEEGYQPDILLFDIVMPLEDGWDLAKEIRNKGYIPNAKLIVLSNQGEETDVKKSKDFNVDGYIVKALKTPSEVVEEVKRISQS